MLRDVSLPAGSRLVRTTPAFTTDTTPAALLSSHRVAEGVWGRLVVLEGAVTYCQEVTDETRMLGAGERQVIEPGVIHHVEPGHGARFVVEFHRVGSSETG